MSGAFALPTATHLAVPAPAEESVPPERTSARKAWRLALRVALTVGLFVLLFWQVRWADVWAAVGSLNTTLLLWTCVMWVPTQYLQFAKWDIMARQAGERVSRADVRRGYWVGYTLGLMTPGRVGQLARGLALHNCSLSRATGLTVVERGYTALVMNAAGLLALAVLPYLGWVAPFGPIGPLATGLCAAGGAALLVLGVFPRSLRRPLLWIVRSLPFREKLQKAVDVLAETGSWLGVRMLVLAIASLATSLLQFVLLIRAAGYEIPVVAGMLAGLLTFFFKGLLPISLGSLGVGEWTAVLCFQGLGVPPAVAVASSLLLFTINVFVPSLIGLPFLATLRVPRRRSNGSSRQ